MYFGIVLSYLVDYQNLLILLWKKSAIRYGVYLLLNRVKAWIDPTWPNLTKLKSRADKDEVINLFINMMGTNQLASTWV